MAKKKKAEPVRSPADSRAGRANVLIENLETQMGMVADGMISVREAVERRMDARFDDVDATLKQLKSSAYVSSEEVRDLRGAMHRRFDAVDKRFDAVDKRFDAVDKRFDAVDQRFDDMDDSVNKRFDDVNAKLDLILAKLDGKTDKNVVDALEERVATLEAG